MSGWRATGIAAFLLISLLVTLFVFGRNDDETIVSGRGSNRTTSTSQTGTSDGTHPSTTDGGGRPPSTRGPGTGPGPEPTDGPLESGTPGPGPTNEPPGPQGPTEADQIARVLEVLGARVFETPGGAATQLMCGFHLWADSILREMSSLVEAGKVNPDTVESKPPSERTQEDVRWLNLKEDILAPRPPEIERWSPWSPDDRPTGGHGLCLYGLGASPITLTLRDPHGAEVTTVSLRVSGNIATVETEVGVQGEMAILVHDGNPPMEIVGIATTPNSRGSLVGAEDVCVAYDAICDRLGLESAPGIYPGAQILVMPANDGSSPPASFTATSGEGTFSGSLL